MHDKYNTRDIFGPEAAHKFIPTHNAHTAHTQHIHIDTNAHTHIVL